MKDYYKRKADFHHEQWQKAFNDNKEKAASYHMQEYINYQERYDQLIKEKGDE